MEIQSNTFYSPVTRNNSEESNLDDFVVIRSSVDKQERDLKQRDLTQQIEATKGIFSKLSYNLSYYNLTVFLKIQKSDYISVLNLQKLYKQNNNISEIDPTFFPKELNNGIRLIQSKFNPLVIKYLKDIKTALSKNTHNYNIENLDNTKKDIDSIKEQLQNSLNTLKEIETSYAKNQKEITKASRDLLETSIKLINKKVIKIENILLKKKEFVEFVEPIQLEEFQSEKSTRKLISNTTGTQPSSLLKARSICITGKEIIRHILNSDNETITPTETPTSSFVIKCFAEHMNTAGTQFNSSHSNIFLTMVKSLLNNQFNFTAAFLPETQSLKNISFNSFETQIKDEFKKFDPNVPFCIQLMTGAQNLAERDHTVVILIKDYEIAYYDPKGVLSREQKFPDGKTLEEGLLLIKEIFFPNNNEVEIIENITRHQHDVHNCGPLVAHYIYQRVVKNQDAHYLDDKCIPNKFLNAFRVGLSRFARKYTQKILQTDPYLDFNAYNELQRKKLQKKQKT
jgi:hypothetical protein